MPQLMPLMWLNSIGVCLLIFMVLVNMYHMKMEYMLVESHYDKDEDNIKLMW